MKGFKQCDRGHFYKEELDSCNYCPKPGVSNSTQISQNDKTQVFGSETNADSDKTLVVGSGGGIMQTSMQSPESSGKRDLSKTFIQGMESKDESSPRTSRKIVGWIISYTLDPMGMDFRIYEGNNTIGRDVTNSIIILKDNGVSGKHVTILCKKGHFYLKDEMAANGTFLNEVEIAIGTPYDLEDGDKIRLGTTTSFRFKSAL